MSETGAVPLETLSVENVFESGKVQQLRKTLHSRSNSEAVRRVIEERLAVEAGLGALRTLRKLGGPEDVFGRASAKKK